jgi:hypothetical protein
VFCKVIDLAIPYGTHRICCREYFKKSYQTHGRFLKTLIYGIQKIPSHMSYLEGLSYLVYGDIAFEAIEFIFGLTTSERSERVCYLPKINEIAAKAISP